MTILISPTVERTGKPLVSRDHQIRCVLTWLGYWYHLNLKMEIGAFIDNDTRLTLLGYIKDNLIFITCAVDVRSK
jgi:hypothetical protein